MNWFEIRFQEKKRYLTIIFFANKVFVTYVIVKERSSVDYHI